MMSVFIFVVVANVVIVVVIGLLIITPYSVWTPSKSSSNSIRFVCRLSGRDKRSTEKWFLISISSINLDGYCLFAFDVVLFAKVSSCRIQHEHIAIAPYGLLVCRWKFVERSFRVGKKKRHRSCHLIRAECFMNACHVLPARLIQSVPSKTAYNQRKSDFRWQ